MRRMRPDVDVLRVQVVRAEVLQQPQAEAVIVGLVDGLVDVAPPDAVLGRGITDDELVPGTASRVLAGVDDERPLGRHDPLAFADRALVELCGREVRKHPSADALVRLPGGWCVIDRGHRRHLRCAADAAVRRGRDA